MQAAGPKEAALFHTPVVGSQMQGVKRLDLTMFCGMQSAGDSELLSAVFPDIDEVKLPLVAMMHERGSSCFDFDYYRSLNTDLQQYATDDQLWGHFLHFGQFERRPFR